MSNAWRRFDAEDNEMRFPGNRWTRADLERLLDGQPVRHDALTEFLIAARTPGARADTAGLAEAMAAYRSISSPVPAEKPRRASMLKNVAAKIVAAKLLTISGVALAATGGIAAAASTGYLPSPLPHSGHASQVAVAAVASSHGKSVALASSPSASATETDSDSSLPSGAHPSATPSPSLRGLCRSWLSRPHEHGKADTNPAFTVLVTAAGGADSVPAYCTALLGAAPSGSETSPSPSASASPDPSASHGHGKPGTVPSASHPSGKPSVLPTPSHPSGR